MTRGLEQRWQVAALYVPAHTRPRHCRDCSNTFLTCSGDSQRGPPARPLCAVNPSKLQPIQQYAPSVFEKYTTSVTVGKKEVTLNLYDTAGQEDYDRLRPLSYQNTNVVLICYDVMNPTSYDNVAAKWYPEVNHFCRGVPLVLIGCKTDLRKDKEQLRKLRASKQEPITYNQGEAACQQINAEVYLECSAKCRENIENVFKEATTIALNAMKKAKRQKKRTVCSVL
ncbi:PREDICTED: rho-related GTP-binding protein RhoF [Pygoscelis adeliae]|nr:PREDICTED: rho-related GTP-binding protein RhoF [Pygoscelis adeliae]